MINPFLLETHKERLVKYANENFNFSDNTHRYFTRFKDSYLSITKLLKEMGISPNYDSVDEVKLQQSIDYGKTIHSDIENYCKFDEIGITNELDEFIKWSKENKINYVASEYMVHNDLLAGTIDLIYKEKGKLVISDIKTTSQIHKDCVSWQLSLYRYLLGENIEKATCIHIRPNLYEVVEIPLKSNEECERLIQAYINNTKYEVELLEKKQVEVLINLQDYVKDLENKVKEAKDKMERIKNYCMSAMDERNLLSVEIEADDRKVKITKVMPKDKESIDYKQLIQDHPEIDIDKYKTYSSVKPYIKIS